MKIETLKDRLDKAKIKVTKKQNTILKKQTWIDKKVKLLEAKGVDNPLEASSYEYRNQPEISWTISDIHHYQDDIKRITDEIAETEKTIEKYEKQLAGELAKEAVLLKEIPEVFNSLRDSLIEEWDNWDIQRKNKIREAYHSMGYKEFHKCYTYADYQFMSNSDKKIHEDNINSAKALILDLYYRVKDITGDITDWTGIRAAQGSQGFTVLNGLVIGKEGRAKVESILAGGYNIQRLHIRVLVHSV